MSENLTVYWFNLPFHVANFLAPTPFLKAAIVRSKKLIEIAAVLDSRFSPSPSRSMAPILLSRCAPCFYAYFCTSFIVTVPWMQVWVYCEFHLFVLKSPANPTRTGIGAYYLHETHPRTGIPPERRLQELVKWKWAKHWGRPQQSTL